MLSIKKDQRKVIIDFNGIQFLSPKAASLLITKNFERFSKKRNQIEIRNLTQITAGAFTNIKNIFSEYGILEKDHNPLKEIEPQPSQDRI